MKHFLKYSLLLSVLLTAAVLSACSAPADDAVETAGGTSAAQTEPAETEYVYPYPETGYGGEDFSILNMEDIYNMMSTMERYEVTGEALNDAIYNRNRLIEEKFDIALQETLVTDTWELKAVASEARTAIAAGDDEYDIMYIPMGGASPLITEGCFLNLREIDTIQFDKDWWNASFNDAITIKNTLYGAVGSANYMVQEGIRLLAYNYSILEDLGLEHPYDLVREGKWTMDAFNSYLTAAASLRGDDSIAWNKDGNVAYGYSHNQTSMESFLFSCGEMMMKNQGDTLSFDCGSDRFYNVIDKLAAVLTTEDAKVFQGMAGDDMDPNEGGYLYAFKTQRALFSQSEVCKFQIFREFDFDFGIVPYPKYDEAQESYISNTWYGTTCVHIPVTSADAEKTGHILDALSYESEVSVIPVYREITVENKGLRNEDSVEMLEIIANSLKPLYHSIFQIGVSLVDQISTSVWNNSGAASAVASNQTSIETELTKLLDAWFE
ncbi:MAG: hypothetical protein IKY52_02825 [Clostridia bacterium]|nr:hypothetical protein [Clostridia bacterium]